MSFVVLYGHGTRTCLQKSFNWLTVVGLEPYCHYKYDGNRSRIVVCRVNGTISHSRHGYYDIIETVEKDLRLHLTKEGSPRASFLAVATQELPTSNPHRNM